MEKKHRVLLRITQILLVAIWFGLGSFAAAATLVGLMTANLLAVVGGIQIYVLAVIVYCLEKRCLRPKLANKEEV
jgi:uncharacterized membrane-anchored protein